MAPSPSTCPLAMDAEEARKAFELARKHDSSGNTDAALKWARKSVAIYSTPEATTLVTRLEKFGAQADPTSSGPSKAADPKSQTIYTSNTTKTTTSNTPGDKREYTEKQVEIVRRVKRAGGDFYAVLEIEKSAQETDVKKSYRKVRVFC